MAYEMVMPYHLHMPSYFLETFTEYPKNKARIRLTSTGLLDYRTKISLYNLVHRRIGENHRRLERFSFLKIHHGV